MVKALIDNRIMKKLSGDEFDASESPIDTEYFGISSAKVILKRACLDDQSQNNLLSFMRDFEFITIVNKANDPSNNRWLGEKTSAFLTDINMQLSKKVSITEKQDDNFLIVSDKFPENGQIIQIAETSFRFSRFLNDPYLPLEKARGIYGDITKNAFGKAGRFFVVFKTAEVIAGFLLFSINVLTSSSTIELIAIDPNHKGRGIGRLLIRSTEHYVRGTRIDMIKVGTQLDNTDALNFYTSNGFNYFEQNSIYHYWPLKG
jgi:ribosomal protein S18 acetylase RimI-like enzyme